MADQAGGTIAAVAGRLVLADRVVAGRIAIEDGLISAVETDDASDPAADATLPYLAPGFVDVHVHGGGGHDAMGDRAALDGMARHLLRRGVTAFLPTAVTAPLPTLADFAARVRTWLPDAPADGAEPLGFNLEGPFLADARRGAHDPTHLRAPADVARDEIEPLLDGPPARDDRPGAARRARSHRLVPRARGRDVDGSLGRDRRRRRGPGTRPAAGRRPTCSMR